MSSTFANLTLDATQHRTRGAVLTAAGSVTAKTVQFAINLLVMRMTFRYLGVEQFGLWAAISSLSLLLGLTDFGIGNSMLNAATHAQTERNRISLATTLSNGTALLGGIAGVLMALLWVFYQVIPWDRLLGVTSPTAREAAGPSVVFALLCFAVSLPLTAAQKYNLAVQKGFMNSVWLAVGGILSLAGVWIGIRLKWSMPQLVLIFSLGQVIALGLTWQGILREHRTLSFKLLSAAICRKLAASGSKFFALQVLTLVMMQLPTLLITWYLGANEVSRYSIANRIAMMCPMALSLIVQPLWPAYTDALARGEHKWMRRAFSLSVQITLALCILFAVFLQLGAQPLTRWWIGSEGAAEQSVVLGVGLFAIGNCLHWVTSTFLNACSQLRGQCFYQIAALFSALTAALTFAPHYGVAAIALSFGVSELLLGLAQMIEASRVIRGFQNSCALS